jgi:hypothetical protein
MEMMNKMITQNIYFGELRYKKMTGVSFSRVFPIPLEAVSATGSLSSKVYTIFRP